MRNIVPIFLIVSLIGPTPSSLAESDGGTLLKEASNRFISGYETRDTMQVPDQILNIAELVNAHSSPFLPSHRIRSMAIAIAEYNPDCTVRAPIPCRHAFSHRTENNRHAIVKRRTGK